MIPSAFDYVRPASIAEAQAALASAVKTDAAILAGGQSLLTALKQRRRRPSLVIDLRGIAELRDVTVKRGTMHVGAMVRQADIVRHPFVRKYLRVLAEAGEAAGDPMIRRLGTLAGAFCEVDPEGDWVAAGLVLDVKVEKRGQRSSENIPLEQFVLGPHEVQLGAGEIVTSLEIPALPSRVRSAYRKAKHIAVGTSIASAAVVYCPDERGSCTWVRIAVAGAPSYPQRLSDIEEALAGADFADIASVSESVRDGMAGLEFIGDRYASADYRAERLAVLIQRTLTELAADDSAHEVHTRGG